LTGEPLEPGVLWKVGQLPPRQRFVFLAEQLGCSSRTVRREFARANRALALVPRRCACGCRSVLPITATRRRRFV